MFRMRVYQQNPESVRLSLHGNKVVVKEGSRVDVPVGRQTFGSGAYRTTVRLYAPPGHAVLSMADDEGFVNIPCQHAETVETDFTITHWYSLDTRGLKGCAIHWMRSDHVGSEPRVLGECLVVIE